MLKCKVEFLLILFFLLSACTPVKEKDLYGTYVANYPFGTEKLTLNAGGEYIQEVFIKGESKTLTHKGHWRYEPEYKYVRLEKGLNIADPAGGLRKDYNVPFNGDVLAKIRRVFPGIRLGTAYEDVDFVKK
jgi:hypothetical protein